MILTDEMIEKFVDIFAERGVPDTGRPGMVKLGWTVRFRMDTKEYEAWVSISEQPVTEVSKKFAFFKWLWPLFNAPFILGHNLFLAYRALVGPKIFASLKKSGKISREDLFVEELLPDEDLPPDKRKEIDDEITYGVFNGKIKPIEEDQQDLENQAICLLRDAMEEDIKKLPTTPQKAKEIGLVLVRRMLSYMPEENLENLMIELGLYER